MQSAAARVVLALLTAWAVGSLCVFVSFLWTPQGTFGLTSDYSGRITSVVPGLPADKAGISPDDRIILSQTPFEFRPKLVGTVIPVPVGATVHFRAQGKFGTRDVSLTAVEATPSPAELLSRALEAISSAILIFVGVALILLRPGPATWGFGLFGLLANPIVPRLARFPSAHAHLVYVSLYDVLQNVGIVGLLVFALNFPQPLPIRWRAVFAQALPAIFLLLAAWTLWIDLAICVFAIPAQPVNFGLQIAFGIAYLLAVLIITETYVKGPTENRPRLRWVLVGFYVGLLYNYIGNFLVYTSNAAVPYWFDATLIASEVALPLAVSYAIIRHRVIQIDLFLSRALVYAILTSLLIAAFGITDWFFGQVLENFRLSLVFDAFLSIGLAFVFDRSEHTLEQIISRVVFRARQIAKDRLDRTAKTFRFVSDANTLDQAIVKEPYEALSVATIALFRYDTDAYHRVASYGWDPQNCSALTRDDRLPLEHLAREGALDLADIPWSRDDVPMERLKPIVSIPLRVANELDGMLLCSLKKNGEGLDPEELAKLVQFCDAAAAAYGRIDAEDLRRRAGDLERQVAVLNGRLDEARRERPTLTS